MSRGAFSEKTERQSRNSSKFKFPYPSFENDSQTLSANLRNKKFFLSLNLSPLIYKSYGFSTSSGSLMILSLGILIFTDSGVVISSGIKSGARFLNFLNTLNKFDIFYSWIYRKSVLLTLKFPFC